MLFPSGHVYTRSQPAQPAAAGHGSEQDSGDPSHVHAIPYSRTDRSSDAIARSRRRLCAKWCVGPRCYLACACLQMVAGPQPAAGQPLWQICGGALTGAGIAMALSHGAELGRSLPML